MEGSRVDESCDFSRAEHLWQANHLLGVGSLGSVPRSFHSLDEEEPQGCEPLVHGIGGQFLIGEQMSLILPNVLGT
jgi:hypothetical protein